MLLVEVHGFKAIAGEIQVGIHLHRFGFPFGELDFEFELHVKGD
jgi:hypothetical protein